MNTSATLAIIRDTEDGVPERPCILGVDDDPSVIEALRLVFEDDADFLAASCGEEAVALVVSRHIDVVLLDLLMPGMDGLESLQRIKALRPRTAVVILTALDRLETAAMAMRSGAFDCIGKPFDEDQLRATVRAALGLRSSQPAAVPGTRLNGDRLAVVILGAKPGPLAALKLMLGHRFALHLASTRNRALELLTTGAPALFVVDDPSPPSSAGWTLRALHEQLRSCAVLVSLSPPAPAAARDLDLPRADVAILRYQHLHELADHISVTLGESSARPSLMFREPAIRAMEYLATHYTCILTLRGIASAAGISMRQLVAVFRADTGMSVMEYAQTLRVAVVKVLLEHDHKGLEELADRAGFSDSSHLSRVFLKHVGVRPGEFHRRLSLPRRLGRDAERHLA